MNQTGYGVYHGCLESKTERISGIAWLGKKVSFIRKFAIISNNFKNRSFSSGQGVFQSEPKWVWSIPWVPRV